MTAVRLQRGVTLIEMMFTMAVLTIVLGGTLMFIISQTKMAVRNFDRSDIQRGGRAALTVLEERISLVGLGLPRQLAIRSFSTTQVCGAVQTQKLEISSVDYRRQWTLAGVSGTISSGTLTLPSTLTDPVPAEPGGASSDIDILQNRWLYLFTNASADGHGLVRVGANRATGADSVIIDLTNYAPAQSSLDLSANSTLDTAAERPTAMLLASTSAFGVNCTDNPDDPYIYWAKDRHTDKTPIASNVDTTPLAANNLAISAVAGDVVGLRFRFLLDRDGNGQADDLNGSGGFDSGDFATDLTFDADPATATNDDVMAIEVLVRLRAEGGQTEQIEDFVRVIHTPNINTRSDSYVFIDNAGI